MRTRGSLACRRRKKRPRSKQRPRRVLRVCRSPSGWSAVFLVKTSDGAAKSRSSGAVLTPWLVTACLRVASCRTWGPLTSLTEMSSGKRCGHLVRQGRIDGKLLNRNVGGALYFVRTFCARPLSARHHRDVHFFLIFFTGEILDDCRNTCVMPAIERNKV